MNWEIAVVGHDPAVQPDQLLANPLNARVHPFRQQQVMEEIFERVGWVRNVLVNQRTGHVIDGHMRVQLAFSNNQTVPVDYLDVSEEDEKYILATFDAVGDQALVDSSAFEQLIAGMATGQAVNAMFNKVQKQWSKLLNEHDDETPADNKGSDDEDEGLGDLYYGMVGWSETKVRCSIDELEALTALHTQYTADNDGKDRGFVQWLTSLHRDLSL